jgi:hypothetical protein
MKAKNYSKRSRGSGMQVLLTFVLISSTFFLNLHSSAQPSVTPTVVNVFCAGDMTGSVTLQVTGAGPFTFLWNNGVTVQNLVHKFAGTYTVTVTDANNATAVSGGTITQPANLPQFAATIFNCSCFGQCDGEIDATPSGGTPGYTYHWQNDETTPHISGLCAGLYFLTVTDANGCRAISNNSVVQPQSALVVIPTVNDIPCGSNSGGSITLSVSGGTGSHTFLWSNGSQNQDLTNVAAGTYTVTVTDEWPCAVVSGGTIQPGPPLDITSSVTHVKCAGDQSGAVAITVNSGQAPFTFLWSNSAQTQNLIHLFAGTYTVTVTDNNGCTGTSSVTITQPVNLPQFAATITNVSCFGQCTGMISATPNGGTPGYFYHWQNNQTTQTISNLCAGLYFLTVTDANGCRAIGNNQVMQPSAPLTVTKTVTGINCGSTSGGSITLTAAGGTVPYKYKWNTGSTAKDLLNIGAGTYTCTVTDAGPCSTVTSGTVSGGTSGLSCNITAIPCNNIYTGGVPTTIYLGYGPQCVTLSSSVGSNGTYNYSWSPYQGLSCRHCAAPQFCPTKKGNYTFTVTISDNSGCSTSCEITICVLDIQVYSIWGCGGGNFWDGPAENGAVEPVNIHNIDCGTIGGGGNKCNGDIRDNDLVYVCHHYHNHCGIHYQNLIVKVKNVPYYVPGQAGDRLGKCDQDCEDNDHHCWKDQETVDAIMEGILNVDVYPNPFTIGVTVNVETTTDEPIWMEIFDMTGRPVMKVDNVLPFMPVQFGNDLPEGFYLLNVHQADQMKTVKMIKNK